MPIENEVIDTNREPFPVEHPLDVFRRRFAAQVTLGVGVLFLILIAGSFAILGMAIHRGESANMEGVTSAAQTILTASIGFIGGAASTTIGYFFQASE